MNQIKEWWLAYVDKQHQQPTGWVGWMIAQRMRHQHLPETQWSIDGLQLTPTDHVLEIGFGAGAGLHRLVADTPGGYVVGVDISMTMARAAIRRHRAASKDGRLMLVCGDVAHLPLARQRYTKILSIHTFYFWPDKSAILYRLLDLLQPGGRLITTFATATKDTDGSYVYWPLQHQAENVMQQLQHQPGIDIQLATGPDSRQFNNVALIIDRL